MSAHRHEGRVGAHLDIVQASDTAYGDHTFVAPSRAGITLPSERFCPAETMTRGEWERRHTAAYKTNNNARAAVTAAPGRRPTGANPVSDNHPTTTGIGSVCITLGDDHHQARTVASPFGSGNRGSVFVGSAATGGTVQIDGTPAQLRSLAGALIAGADDIEAVLVERTDRDMAAQA